MSSTPAARSCRRDSVSEPGWKGTRGWCRGNLAAGAGQAAAGSVELSTGLNQLVGGTDELGAGAKQISELVDTVTGPLLSVLV